MIGLTAFVAERACAEQGDDNPTGVAGAFNGSITTAGSYDPYTGNMQRRIDDIVVPGTIGAYPLKWTRYWNSHTNWRDNQPIGAAWRFSYLGYIYEGGYPPNFPDGRQLQDNQYGVEEWKEEVIDPNTYLQTGEILHLSDGGKVVLFMFGNIFYPSQIIDPYGQTTNIVYTYPRGSAPVLDKIVEPGGRYLKVIGGAQPSRVEAYDGVNSQPIQWVNYHSSGSPWNNIDQVDYSDGTSAHYTSVPAYF